MVSSGVVQPQYQHQQHENQVLDILNSQSKRVKSKRSSKVEKGNLSNVAKKSISFLKLISKSLGLDKKISESLGILFSGPKFQAAKIVWEDQKLFGEGGESCERTFGES